MFSIASREILTRNGSPGHRLGFWIRVRGPLFQGHLSLRRILSSDHLLIAFLSVGLRPVVAWPRERWSSCQGSWEVASVRNPCQSLRWMNVVFLDRSFVSRISGLWLSMPRV